MILTKKFVSITLAAALVMGLMTSAFAVDTEANVLPHQLPNGVIENVKDNQIFRSYTPADNVLQFNGETISVSQLKTLGFPADYIESFDAKTLSVYTHAKKIETTTTYYKTDYTNNTTEVISEEEANRLAAEANAAENSSRNNSNVHDYDVLVIKTIVAYLGNDELGKKFKFTTITEWKTQPAFTQRDGIGTYVPEATITPNTGSIMLRCRKKTLDRTGHVVRDEAYSKQGTITVELSNNYSSGGEIKLPAGGSALKYTDLTIYHSFEGHLQSTNTTKLNVSGSYLHQHTVISVEPIFIWILYNKLPTLGVAAELKQVFTPYTVQFEYKI